MPVCLSRDSSSQHLLGSAANCLDIGLVNNMPGKALQATERQFLTLLESAADGVVVRLWLYALPDVPRTASGGRHIGSFYSGIEKLWDRHLDGLIVTGTEPRASNLMDEPYWANMARLIEWAEQNTHSTVWSCLAAHAAVLHIDGIARRRLSQKRFGLLECDRVSEHQLTGGIPSRLVMPHSRWNDIPEDELAGCGYRILTRSEDAGADSFVKQRKSLFVFCQGHPEYDADTLLREYLRDVGNYLKRESETYPQLPRGYFDRATADALTAVRERALCDRRPEVLTVFPTALIASNLANTWHPSAARIYRNWLTYLCDRKQQSQMHRPLKHWQENPDLDRVAYSRRVVHP
jgi:homoserine O-succinyltransferase